MEILIVTRHKPLVKWLERAGIVGPVLDQATPDDVRGKHVYGILPLWLAAEAESVSEVSMPLITLAQRKALAGGDFSIQEMDAAGASIVTYTCAKKIMNFGQYTRLKRTEAGVSQQMVADALNLPHRSMVHRRETGENEWRWSEVVKLSYLLGIKLSTFVSEFEDGN